MRNVTFIQWTQGKFGSREENIRTHSENISQSMTAFKARCCQEDLIDGIQESPAAPFAITSNCFLVARFWSSSDRL